MGVPVKEHVGVVCHSPDSAKLGDRSFSGCGSEYVSVREGEDGPVREMQEVGDGLRAWLSANMWVSVRARLSVSGEDA